MNLKDLFKRGALLAAANWPVVVIQFLAETTYQALLMVPLVGAAVLVAVLLGADVAELLQGSLRDIFTTIANALLEQPIALAAFVASFALALLGGSALTFVVKSGTVDVLVGAAAGAGPVEREPLTLETLTAAARFSLPRFTNGCSRLYRPYLILGGLLMAVYGVSLAGYVVFVFYGYRAAGSGIFVLGWTFIAALATAALIGWFTIVNLLYLLTQIAIAVESTEVVRGAAAVFDGFRAALRFVRAEFRELAAVFGVVVVLVVVATLASWLAWSGVALIAFVPLIGLAIVPLQIVALALRGLLFEYLGLTALGAYLALYTGSAARPFSPVLVPRTPLATTRAGGS
ncbi:MAG TPA: hypothetical protein VEU08_13750 [Vicinamibacterales bacterium]|nr:hypothetical protein [Vicinamibacterales bacterium]